MKTISKKNDKSDYLFQKISLPEKLYLAPLDEAGLAIESSVNYSSKYEKEVRNITFHGNQMDHPTANELMKDVIFYTQNPGTLSFGDNSKQICLAKVRTPTSSK